MIDGTREFWLVLFGGFFFVLVLLGFFFYGLIKSWQKQVQHLLKSLSLDVMEKNSRSFLDLAKIAFEKYHVQSQGEIEGRQRNFESLLKPFKESLEKLDSHQRELEKQREGAYVGLQKQIEGLIHSEHLLRGETTQLVKALKSPNVRGSWGQIHLKRVVELSGMLQHCDFFEQVSQYDEEKLFRPDLLVHLPGDRSIIIDAKTPIEAYLEAMETNNPEIKEKKIKEHAAQLKKHIKDLSRKEYWKKFEATPEYVILFLPAESFFSTALQEDPSLIEQGALLNVILATPTTLIAILRAISYSWKQEKWAYNTKEIIKVGQELYERIDGVTDYWSKLGKSLSQSVATYNQAIASYETRVLVSMRKLKDLGVSLGDQEVKSLEEITQTVRSLKDYPEEKDLLIK